MTALLWWCLGCVAVLLILSCIFADDDDEPLGDD